MSIDQTILRQVAIKNEVVEGLKPAFQLESRALLSIAKLIDSLDQI